MARLTKNRYVFDDRSLCLTALGWGHVARLQAAIQTADTVAAHPNTALSDEVVDRETFLLIRSGQASLARAVERIAAKARS